MTPLEKLIDQSREMLTWPDDWDGEGARAVDKNTWEYAISFLRVFCTFESFPLPNIAACSDETIDLYWKYPMFTLLINIDVDRSLSFYGESGVSKIKGSMSYDEHAWLSMWVLAHHIPE